MALMPGVFLYTVSYEPSPEPGGWYVTLIRLNITELRSGRATFGLGLLIPVPLHSPPPPFCLSWNLSFPYQEKRDWQRIGENKKKPR